MILKEDDEYQNEVIINKITKEGENALKNEELIYTQINPSFS